MPRSVFPQRYPTICFRLAGLLETRTEPFHLDFSTQREAIDLRQTLVSFSNACRRESERKAKSDLQASHRWFELFTSLGRWQLAIDPPYSAKRRELLDYPARLNFHPRDLLPKHLVLEDQLAALEQPSEQGEASPSPYDDLMKGLLGSSPDPSNKGNT